MSDTRLRARTATEIVDAAFQLLRRDALQYIVVASLAYAPMLILQLVVFGVDPEQQVLMFSTGAGWLLLLGYWLSFALMSAVTIRMSAEVYHGRRPDAAAVLRDVLPRVPAIMIATMIKYFLMVIGFIFLIFPSLYVAARYFGVTQAVVLEGHGPFGAMGRSARLSKGRKWHILGALLLVFIIVMVGTFAAVVIGALTQSDVLATVLSTVATVVVYPLFAITEMLLFYDTRIRAEGYDIEVMTEALETAGTAPEPAR
jgi:hypothetical protein